MNNFLFWFFFTIFLKILGIFITIIPPPTSFHLFYLLWPPVTTTVVPQILSFVLLHLPCMQLHLHVFVFVSPLFLFWDVLFREKHYASFCLFLFGHHKFRQTQQNYTWRHSSSLALGNMRLVPIHIRLSAYAVTDDWMIGNCTKFEF